MNTTRRITIALIFLLVAVALLVVVNRSNLDTQANDQGTPELTGEGGPGPLFPDAQSEQVTRIEVISSETDQRFVAELQDDGTWAILEAPEGTDTSLPVDQQRLSNGLAYVPQMAPTRLLSSVEELATYGLGDEVSYTIHLTIGDTEYTLLIGLKNISESDYYVQLEGSAGIYLIGTYNIDPLISFLEEPPYMTVTPTTEVTATPTPEATETPEATPEATATPNY